MKKEVNELRNQGKDRGAKSKSPWRGKSIGHD